MRTSLTEEPLLKINSHLIGIPDTDWAFWRWIGLRSAGFPAGDILQLAALPDVGEAADRVQAALQAKDFAFARALRQMNSALDALRQNGQWDDRQKRDPLLKAKRKLEMKQLPASSPETDSFESIQYLRTCCAEVESAHTTFQDRFAKSFDLVSGAIAGVAASPRFREALTWQNRKLVGVALDGIRKKRDRSPDRNSRLRQHEEVVAAYLQRYCVKNDSIGFFGPVGWGRFVAEGDRLTSVPGRELVTARHTYWEAWPIEKLASVISQVPGVLPWVPPLAMPFLRLEGETLHHPVLAPVQLTSRQAAVLRSCNGIDTAGGIAAKMLRLSEPLFRNQDEVYACLTDLAARNIIFWEIYIPADAYPERALRAALEKNRRF